MLVPLFTNLVKSAPTPSLSYSLRQFFAEVFGFSAVHSDALSKCFSDLIALHLPSSYPLSPVLEAFVCCLVSARHEEEEQDHSRRLHSLQKSFTQPPSRRHVSSALEQARLAFADVTSKFSSLQVSLPSML